MGISNICLINKTCTPCQGGVPSLNTEIVEKFLEELKNDWVLNEVGHLSKEYVFNDFKQAMNFANKVTEIAEQEGHHPDLKITWGKCMIDIWTHKINGLTESDFILAAKIEATYEKR
jgi:4a-hydroxytetrahydrobiopterin dehydratase